jgi:hypothetical protein
MRTTVNTMQLQGIPFWIDRFHVLIFFGLAIAIRWPLWQAGLPLNGDESILALMAKHLSEGQSIPLYFYGQQYGFTGLETIVLALGFELCGLGEVVFRSALLLIWAGGLSFFYRFLKNVLGDKVGLTYVWLICFAMLCAPVWMRVGYVSPFFFTSVLLYFLSLENRHWLVSIGIGLAFLLAIESHKLWAAPLLIMTLAFAVPRWTKQRWGIILGLVTVLLAILYAYKLQLHDAWHPEVIDWNNLNLSAVRGLPEALWINLSGFYYLEDIYDSPMPVQVAVWVFLGVLLLAFLPGLKQNKEDCFRVLRWVLVVCLVGILGYALVTRKASPRYLMPWAQFGFLLIALGLWRWGRQASTLILGLLIIVSISSAYAFKSYSFYTVSLETLEELRDACDAREISTAYCTEPLASWQIIYYSREVVQTRYKGQTDRYPAYVAKCDSALTAIGTATLIGRKWKIPDLIPEYISSDGEMAIYTGLTRAQLMALGFEFGDPWQEAR